MSIAEMEPTTTEAVEATNVGAPTVFSRISHVFLVDRIEPCLGFWVDRLGFEVRLRIDGNDHLEFVILGRDDVEVAYRTRDSLHEATPGLIEGQHRPWVVMYLEVENLDDLLPKLEGLEIAVPLRQTCLGTREVFVVEPSGRIVAISSRYAEAA